jgi:glycosyltransferase involved in cell wall biosynthesis
VKIALIVPGGVDRSGTERVIPALLALIKRLAASHELHVYSLYQESEPGEWELLGARVHNLGRNGTRRRALQAIRAEHKRGPFGVLQAFFSATPGLIAVTAGRLLGIPSCVHVAGGELVALADIGYGGRLTRRGRIREWLVLRGATRITTPSHGMVSALAQLGISAQRLALGVDRSAWPSRVPVPRPAGISARLLHVGSLNRVKDQSTLLRAFAALIRAGGDAHLDIVGEDTLQGQIQAEAQALGVAERVTFHGFLTQCELRPLFEASQLLIMSSRHEAGPIVALEAALVGVPTVGTAVGVIAEWHPLAALAADIGDAAGIARLIDSLLKDDQRRLQLAREAQRRAELEDADYSAGSFERLYATLGCS